MNRRGTAQCSPEHEPSLQAQVPTVLAKCISACSPTSYKSSLIILTCIIKTGTAGFVAGWVFKLFKGKARIPGMFISALLVPIINTGIFLVAASTIFRPGLKELLGATNENFGVVLFSAFIGINFIFEVVSTILLSPSIVMVIKRFVKSETTGDDIGDNLYKSKEELAYNDSEENK